MSSFSAHDTPRPPRRSLPERPDRSGASADPLHRVDKPDDIETGYTFSGGWASGNCSLGPLSEVTDTCPPGCPDGSIATGDDDVPQSGALPGTHPTPDQTSTVPDHNGDNRPWIHPWTLHSHPLPAHSTDGGPCWQAADS